MYLLTVKLDTHGNVHNILVQANSIEEVHNLAGLYLESNEYKVEDLTNPTDLNGAASELLHIKNNLMSGGRHGSHYDGDDRHWPGVDIKP